MSIGQASELDDRQQRTRSTPVTREAARSKSTLGEDAAPAPGHEIGPVPRDFRQVKGWGADLDPANRPAVPREFPSSVMTARGEVTARQEPLHEIFKSNEQPDLTPVFGDSCPPKGLSGALRRYAYQFGEGTNRRWMTMVMGDRIDRIESMVTDALRGRPDNFVAERAWPAKWKYADTRQRTNAVAIGAAIAGALALGIYLASRGDE